MSKESRKAKACEKHAPDSPRQATGNVAVEQISTATRTEQFSEAGETAGMEDLVFTAAWTGRAEAQEMIETNSESAALVIGEARHAEAAGYDAAARAMETADATGREAEMQVIRAVLEAERAAEASQREAEGTGERSNEG